jgi:hypothetical protein
MGETEVEVRLEKKIKLLQSQINNLGAQLKRLYGQITHPSVLAQARRETTNNLGDLLGATNQVIVTHGKDAVYRSDDVTLNLPQDMHTGAIPVFAGLGLGTIPVALFHMEGVTGAVQRLTRKDTTVGTGDIIGRFEFETQDAGSAGIAVYIQAEAEGSGGKVGLAFASGVGGSAIERIRIKNTGVINMYLPPIYATNAAALLGGLVSGDVYRTGGLTDYICIVHP